MPNKIVFDEPLVRFDITKARFPPICPVCGARATKTVQMVVNPSSMDRLDGYDRLFARSIMKRSSAPSNRRFLMIPVCEDHYYSSDDMCRLRTLCIIGTSLAFGITWMAYFKIGNAIIFHQETPLWALLTFAGFIASIILSAIAFRPSKLERSVKIIGFDPSLASVIVDFKSPEYRDLFISENPMNATLVKWIVKGRA
ncbi:MAG: hypothetical protein K9W43_07535 [Candidatus Thorarchaeota archaeon]|nr:hypothetical protein [Candidatus Thorarchaeota archaeon]